MVASACYGSVPKVRATVLFSKRFMSQCVFVRECDDGGAAWPACFPLWGGLVDCDVLPGHGVQSLFEPTHGKPAKIALKQLLGATRSRCVLPRLV